MQHKAFEEKARTAAAQRIDGIYLPRDLMRNGPLWQFFLTHSVTGGAAIALFFALAQLQWSLPASIGGVIAISGLLGLLLTANIHYHVQQIETALTSLARGEHVLTPAFAWPFRQIFTRLRDLDRRVQTYVEGERAAAEIRRQYLQQASEAATVTERQRIARDLHDSIKQQLFSISVSAASAKAYWQKDSSKAYTAVADIQRVTKEAQVEMQALLQQLSFTPLENTRLADALSVQAEALKYRSGLEMDLSIGDIPSAELLPVGTQETIFRLVQEAFANIARHARAKHVAVTLRQTERTLHLIVSDDGQGFDSQQARAGMGLTNMRERIAVLQGTIEVHSALGQGTRLHMQLPLIQPQVPEEDVNRAKRDFVQGIARSSRDFQMAGTAQGLAVFFIAVSQIMAPVPIAVFAICLLVAGYGLLQGHLVKRRLLIERGNEHPELLSLRQKEERLCASMLLSFLMGETYLVALHPEWIAPAEIAGFILLFVLLIVLMVVNQWYMHRTRDLLYRSMAPEELHREIATQRTRVTRYSRSWLALGALGLLFLGNLVMSQSRTGLSNGRIYLAAPFFLVIGSFALFGSMILRQQRRALAAKQTQVPVRSTFLGE